MKKVITFGEIMLRLTPPAYNRFVQTNKFNMLFGGSEANVAAVLAALGTPVSFVSRIPSHEMGQACINSLRRYGIDTQHIVRGGDRLGIYFLEEGAAVRAPKVIYDRANSAFSVIQPQMFNWEEIFQDADWFHWSGIVPATTPEAAEVCKQAIRAARKLGLIVSCDLNFRKNLWNYGKKASEVMPEMVAMSDVIVGAMAEYTIMLGAENIPFKATDSTYVIDKKLYEKQCQFIEKKYPLCKKMFILRRNSVNTDHDIYTGMVYSEGVLKTGTIYDNTPVLDKVGVGDAFAGAMIHGLHSENFTDEEVLQFALAASTLKNTINGDFDLINKEEVHNLLQGGTSGRVIR